MSSLKGVEKVRSPTYPLHVYITSGIMLQQNKENDDSPWKYRIIVFFIWVFQANSYVSHPSNATPQKIWENRIFR